MSVITFPSKLECFLHSIRSLSVECMIIWATLSILDVLAMRNSKSCRRAEAQKRYHTDSKAFWVHNELIAQEERMLEPEETPRDIEFRRVKTSRVEQRKGKNGQIDDRATLYSS